MSNTKVRVAITNQVDGTTVNVELPADASMSRLMPALVTKMQLPSDVQYSLYSKRLGRPLLLSDTLASSGVQDNDTLLLVPNVAPDDDIPVRSFRDIQLAEAVLRNGELIWNLTN
jgi:hypothetical protein